MIASIDEPIISTRIYTITNKDGEVTGTPVVNVVIAPRQNPAAIHKAIYSSFEHKDEFLPFGVLFRSAFACNLATDKRDVLAFMRDRETYYSMDANGTIYGAKLPKEEPIVTIITDESEIRSLAPPISRDIKLKRISAPVN